MKVRDSGDRRHCSLTGNPASWKCRGFSPMMCSGFTGAHPRRTYPMPGLKAFPPKTPPWCHFALVILRETFQMRNINSIPDCSPLGCILQNWSMFSYEPMEKKKMIFSVTLPGPSISWNQGEMAREWVLELRYYLIVRFVLLERGKPG